MELASVVCIDALKEALDPEKVCQAEPKNKCDALKKLCDKYKGTMMKERNSWKNVKPSVVNQWVLCNVLYR
ncbi:MAG: hypothetical protein BWK78_06455 [Thiotrichaceae bacterium IS1]|nr:MAG: hypothetical protein BWK78_06455 [Thiotrichaceae bacterium IS1]